MNLIVGITGATGVALGIRCLRILRNISKVQTHLIISPWANRLIEMEDGISLKEAKNLADYYYENDDLTAPITSGSFHTDGMAIIPCTTSTLAAVANGISNKLITRAAAVTLKERRKLVLVIRETPLSHIIIENMLKAAKAGAVILPPVLTFYHKPKNIDDMVDYIVGKTLDIFEIDHKLFNRWEGRP